MVRNQNWMTNRLRYKPPQRFRILRTIRFLDLPDELLLRVITSIHKGGQRCLDARSLASFGDLRSMSFVCTKFYALVQEAIGNISLSAIHMQPLMSSCVLTKSPHNVRQGLAMVIPHSALKTVHFNLLPEKHLLVALNMLATNHATLKELAFVDVGTGVELPSLLAERLETLIITAPRERTLRHLQNLNCSPVRFELHRVSSGMVPCLTEVWSSLERRVNRLEVSLSGRAPSMDERCGLDHMLSSMIGIEVDMFRWQTKFDMPFGVVEQLTVRQRIGHEQEREETVVRLEEWLQLGTLRFHWEPQEVLPELRFGGVPSLTVIIDNVQEAKVFLNDADRNMKQFRETVISNYKGRIHKLIVCLPKLRSYDECKAMALAAVKIASAATAVDIMTIDTKVAHALIDVNLPNQVQSIGFTGKSANERFVRSLPSVLQNLGRGVQGRVVWMERMKLSVGNRNRKRSALIGRAIAATRYAANKGLICDSVRGVLEEGGTKGGADF